jgi:hypothetical protein
MMVTMDQSREAGMSARALLRVVGDLVVAAVLALVLGAVYLIDSRAVQAPSAPPSLPKTAGVPPPPPDPPPPPPPPSRKVDSTPRVVVDTTPDGRFGLVSLTGNPDDPSDDNKQLTFSRHGETNNTRVMVDGRAPTFGDSQGETVESWHSELDGSMVIVWSYRQVLVREAVRLVPGDLSDRIDTMRVTYALKNTGSTAHEVGIRVMLDTLIGGNDGVPFIVPGREGMVTEPLVMRGPDVPDFVQSLEREDLRNPGVIVDIGLYPHEGEERPSELVLTHWPGGDAEWDYDRSEPFGHDSAAGIYYEPRPLLPGQTRSVGFSYGLGTISSTATKNARLSLTAGGPIRAGSSFWFVALVNSPRPGQTVTLTLPDGLTLRRPVTSSQEVKGSGAYTQLSWLVEVASELIGSVAVEAALEPGGFRERQMFTIQPADVQLSLVARGPFRSGRSFWVSALVRNPRAGQSVTLTLTDGLTFAEGHGATSPVAAGKTAGYAQVNWLVVPTARLEGERDLIVRLSPDAVDSRATIQIAPGDLTH